MHKLNCSLILERTNSPRTITNPPPQVNPYAHESKDVFPSPRKGIIEHLRTKTNLDPGIKKQRSRLRKQMAEGVEESVDIQISDKPQAKDAKPYNRIIANKEDVSDEKKDLKTEESSIITQKLKELNDLKIETSRFICLNGKHDIFEELDEKKGFQMWHIVNITPFPLAPKEVSGFYTGDCYIAIQHTPYFGNLTEPKKLFLYLGKYASAAKRAICITLGMCIMKRYEGEFQSEIHITRVEMGEEPDAFLEKLNEWVSGRFKYIPGESSGVTLQKIKKSEEKPKLFSIEEIGTPKDKAKLRNFDKNLYLARIPFPKMLKSSTVYILESESTVFLWIGSKSLCHIQLKGREIAQLILEEEHSRKFSTMSPSDRCKLKIELEGHESDEFLVSFEENQNKEPKNTQNQSNFLIDALFVVETTEIQIPRTDKTPESTEYKFTLQKMGKNSSILSDKSYIFETNNELMLWFGKNSVFLERRFAWNAANKIHKEYCPGRFIRIAEFFEGNESILFQERMSHRSIKIPGRTKTYFFQKTARDGSYTWSLQDFYTRNHKSCPIFVSPHFHPKKRIQDHIWDFSYADPKDDGSGWLKIWRIADSYKKISPVDPNTFNQFWSDECYICMYYWSPNSSLEQITSDSSRTSSFTSTPMTPKINESSDISIAETSKKILENEKNDNSDDDSDSSDSDPEDYMYPRYSTNEKITAVSKSKNGYGSDYSSDSDTENEEIIQDDEDDDTRKPEDNVYNPNYYLLGKGVSLTQNLDYDTQMKMKIEDDKVETQKTQKEEAKKAAMAQMKKLNFQKAIAEKNSQHQPLEDDKNGLVIFYVWEGIDSVNRVSARIRRSYLSKLAKELCTNGEKLDSTKSVSLTQSFFYGPNTNENEPNYIIVPQYQGFENQHFMSIFHDRQLLIFDGKSKNKNGFHKKISTLSPRDFGSATTRRTGNISPRNILQQNLRSPRIEKTNRLMRVYFLNEKNHKLIETSSSTDQIKLSKLNSNDIFILLSGFDVHLKKCDEIYLWIGNFASKEKKEAGLKYVSEIRFSFNVEQHNVHVVQEKLADEKQSFIKKFFSGNENEKISEMKVEVSKIEIFQVFPSPAQTEPKCGIANSKLKCNSDHVNLIPIGKPGFDFTKDDLEAMLCFPLIFYEKTNKIGILYYCDQNPDKKLKILCKRSLWKLHTHISNAKPAKTMKTMKELDLEDQELIRFDEKELTENIEKEGIQVFEITKCQETPFFKQFFPIWNENEKFVDKFQEFRENEAKKRSKMVSSSFEVINDLRKQKPSFFAQNEFINIENILTILNLCRDCDFDYYSFARNLETLQNIDQFDVNLEDPSTEDEKFLETILKHAVILNNKGILK